MRYRLLPLVLSLAATPALAETCKYIDKDGRTIYSERADEARAQDRLLRGRAAPVAPRSSTAPAATRAPGASDGSRPRVEPNTQRQRDNDRRQILEGELAREQKALTQARKALAEQEAVRAGGEQNYARVQERLKPYQETVAMHEKNISIPAAGNGKPQIGPLLSALGSSSGARLLLVPVAGGAGQSSAGAIPAPGLPSFWCGAESAC